MARVYLIRHASVDGLGDRIYGRSPGIHLNQVGKFEADRLAERLRGSAIVAVYSSPCERAIETANVLAHELDLQTVVDEDLDEIDFGDWTGRSISELRALPEWERFNTHRESTRIPHGEMFGQVVQRATRALARVQNLYPHSRVAFVTHADWIRAVVSHYLNVPFSEVLKVQVPPASMAILDHTDTGYRVTAWKDRAASAGPGESR